MIFYNELFKTIMDMVDQPYHVFLQNYDNIHCQPILLFVVVRVSLLLEHLWYFDPKTLNRYLSRFGFQQVEVSEIWYPTDVGSIARRVRQTYGWALFPLPNLIQNRVISLPIGLMFGAYRWNG